MYCLNLCDLLVKSDFENGYMEKLFHVSTFAEVERIYIGSYFCSQYFIEMDYLSCLKAFLKVHPFMLTLVIPVISEKNLSCAKERIRFIIRELPVDEITVNDPGMLLTISDYLPIHINLGRLFFKDERDIRFPLYFKKKTYPQELEYYKCFIKQYPIRYAELDPISDRLDIEYKNGINLALHKPFCYMSYGNICKFASINKEIIHKFRPNSSCKKECINMFEIYEPENSDYKLFRIGRAIFFMNEQPQIINGVFNRIIYFPFNELINFRKDVLMHENFSAT